MRGTPRPERFWAHRIPREGLVRLRVVGIYPDHVKVRVVAGEESMVGQETNADRRQLLTWGADPADIRRIKVGTEFRMRSKLVHGKPQGVITGWNHKEDENHAPIQSGDGDDRRG